MWQALNSRSSYQTMTKMTRLIKRMVALFLVVLMSIENFAAVVGDNDGAAFITKAEFDSLKNNFQSQIDQYNTSIDSKIDGAIASYLAGINVAKTSIERIITSSYDKFHMINCELKNKFVLPSFDYSFSMLASYTEGDGSGWSDVGGCLFTKNYQNNTEFCTINTVGGATVNGGVMNYDNIYWTGQNKTWQERWVIGSQYAQDLHIASGFQYYAYDLSFYIARPLKVNQTGYFETLGNITTPIFSKPKFWMYGYNGWSAYTAMNRTDKLSDDKGHLIESLAIDCNTEDNDVNFNYRKIGCWNADTEFEVGASEFSKYIGYSDYQDLTTEDLTNALGNGANNYVGLGWGCAQNTAPWDASSYHNKRPYTMMWQVGGNVIVSDADGTPPNMGDAAAEKLPNLGIFGKFTGSSILQNKKNVFNGLYDINPENVNLAGGLPLLVAKADEKIEYKPTFTIVAKPGAEAYNEIRVMFATSPFTTKKENLNLIKFTRGGIEYDYIDTVDKKLNAEWTMPKDAVVYMKWFPIYSNEQAIDNNEWEIILNIKDYDDNKTYKLTQSS